MSLSCRNVLVVDDILFPKWSELLSVLLKDWKHSYETSAADILLRNQLFTQALLIRWSGSGTGE